MKYILLLVLMISANLLIVLHQDKKTRKSIEKAKEDLHLLEKQSNLE